MRKRNRDRPKARRTPFRTPKPIILILTEGAVTEPNYLNGFAAAQKNARVEIEIVGGAGAPKTIVEQARKRKKEAENQAKREGDSNLEYNEVWCVFDIDDHAKIPDAKQQARDNDLKLAISNPCIELWLWLHFADQPGMRDRHELQGKMKKHIPGYNKQVQFADYESGYEAAVRRAHALDDDATADGEEGRNPTTGIWRLTESIRENA